MVPVSVIATNICQNFGDTTRKFFGEHMTNIIEVYKFLSMFLIEDVNVQTVILSPDNLGALPCDFIRETKIGVINPLGRIAVMSLDANLRVPPKVTTDTQVQNALNTVWNGTCKNEFFTFYNTWDTNKNYIGQRLGFACALNPRGYFKPDRKNGVIIINETVADGNNIIMEYISDGISNGLRLVPSELVSCITNGAKARFCLDKNDNRASSFQIIHENDFRNARDLYVTKPINMYAELMRTIVS